MGAAHPFKTTHDVETEERSYGGPGGRWRVHDAVVKDEMSSRSAVSVFVLNRDGLDAVPKELRARARDSFVRDSSVLRRLQHPNVLACIEVGSGGLAMVTERVRFSLADLLARPASSPRQRPQTAFGWSCILAEVAAALRYCSAEHKLVHLDVSPENIYFGEDGRWKLGGFGFCRQIGAPLAWSAPGSVVLEHRAGECPRGSVTAACSALFADGSVRDALRDALCAASRDGGSGSIAVEPTAPCAPEIIPLPLRPGVARVERLASHASDVFALGCLGLRVLLPSGNLAADDPVLRSAALLSSSAAPTATSAEVESKRQCRLDALAVLHRPDAIAAMRLPPLLGTTLLRLLAEDPAARLSADAFIASDCFPESVLRTVGMVATFSTAKCALDEASLLSIAEELPKCLEGFPEATIVRGPMQVLCRMLALHAETQSALVAPLLACALRLSVRLSAEAFREKLMPVLTRLVGCSAGASPSNPPMLVLLQSMPLLVAKGDAAFTRTVLVPLVSRSLEGGAVAQMRESTLSTLPSFAAEIEYDLLKEMLLPRLVALLSKPRLGCSAIACTVRCLRKLLEAAVLDPVTLRHLVAPALAGCASVMGSSSCSRSRTAVSSSSSTADDASTADAEEPLHVLLLACFALLADQLGAAATATFIIPQLLRWLYERELSAEEVRAIGCAVEKMTVWVVRSSRGGGGGGGGGVALPLDRENENKKGGESVRRMKYVSANTLRKVPFASTFAAQPDLVRTPIGAQHVPPARHRAASADLDPAPTLPESRSSSSVTAAAAEALDAATVMGVLELEYGLLLERYPSTVIPCPSRSDCVEAMEHYGDGVGYLTHAQLQRFVSDVADAMKHN